MNHRQVSRWPLILRLACALLAKDEPQIKNLSGEMRQSDWNAFFTLVLDRHRIAPNIAESLVLANPPGDIREKFDQAIQRNAMDVLRYVSETRRIDVALRDIGIKPTYLKGWLLAEQLFGAPSARQAKDLDLLIPGDARSRAMEVLQGLGYVPDERHPDRYLDASTDAVAKELNNLSLLHQEMGLSVEMHWRSHQFSGWPDVLANPNEHQIFASSAGKYLVPGDQANLIYLAVHGSLHRWSRLKWLHDIAEIAGRRDPDLLAQDLEEARRLGVGRALALALDLSHYVLGAPMDWKPVASPWLVARCLEEIASDSAVPTSLGQRMKFYAMTLVLAQGWRQKAGVLRYRVWGKPRILLASLGKPA